MNVQLLHLKLNRHESEQLVEDMKITGDVTPGAIVVALVARLEQDAEQDAELAATCKKVMKLPMAKMLPADAIPKDFDKIWEEKKARIKAASQQCLDAIQ